MSSQENDETEERETGSTVPADSVRRLGVSDSKQADVRKVTNAK